MNAIHKEITAADEMDSRIERKSAATLAREILDHLEAGAPFHTTFVEGIPEREKPRVEEQLQKAFELWANSWIAPKCRAIILKGKGAK